MKYCLYCSGYDIFLDIIFDKNTRETYLRPKTITIDDAIGIIKKYYSFKIELNLVNVQTIIKDENTRNISETIIDFNDFYNDLLAGNVSLPCDIFELFTLSLQNSTAIAFYNSFVGENKDDDDLYFNVFFKNKETAVLYKLTS